jgi:hypothetical protein
MAHVETTGMQTQRQELVFTGETNTHCKETNDFINDLSTVISL